MINVPVGGARNHTASSPFFPQVLELLAALQKPSPVQLFGFPTQSSVAARYGGFAHQLGYVFPFSSQQQRTIVQFLLSFLLFSTLATD